MQEFSNLSQDLEMSNAFRRETIAYVEASLKRKTELELSQISTNPIITSFKPVAEAVTKAYSSRECTRFRLSLAYLTLP